MDVGCHVLDRIDFLCGPLVNVQGTAQNRNSPNVPVEDYVHLCADIGTGGGEWAAILNSAGARVECTWDFASTSPPCDELVLTGPLGSIKLAGMVPDGPIVVMNTEGKIIRELEFDMPEHTAQQLIQAVIDDLRGLPRKDYLSRGENAVRTSKVLDTALLEYYGDRSIGYWDRKDSWPGRPTV